MIQARLGTLAAFGALGALLSSFALLTLSVGCETSPPKPVQHPAAPIARASAVAVLPMPAGLDEAAMDPSVAPCDDFYRFACGKWIEHAEIRADLPLANRSFVSLYITEQEDAKKLLEEAAAGKASPLLGDLYAACTDETKLDASLAPLKAELAAVDAIRDDAALSAFVGLLHARGIAAFFDYGVTPDYERAETMIAEIDQGGMALPAREFYTSDDPKMLDVRQHYTHSVSASLAMLGQSEPSAKADAAAILDVETRIAKSALTPLERRDQKRMKNEIDLAGLTAKAKRFAWGAFFKSAGTPSVTKLNVTNPPLLDGLEQQIESLSWPAKRAYLKWRITSSAMVALPIRFREAELELRRALSGTEKVSDRWRVCGDLVGEQLADVMSQAYVARHFDAATKARVTALAHAITGRLRARLETLAWMDVETRSRALEKLSHFVEHFGYPDRYRSYDGLVLDRSSFFRSLRASTAFEQKYKDAKLDKPVDHVEWAAPATTINMWNSLSKNEVTFPAAILHPPIFDMKASDAVDLGSAGVFIGHEFTHGFDDQGRQFDAHGATHDWWTPSSDAAFRARTSCLKSQFDKETWLEGVPVDSALTLGENIADLGGAKLAYEAMMASKGTAERADRAERTERYDAPQQFFLGYAQVWCTKYRPELARRLAKSDPHSPPALRVNMPLRNMQEFQDAFQCPAGSKMVRPNAERCSVW